MNCRFGRHLNLTQQRTNNLKNQTLKRQSSSRDGNGWMQSWDYTVGSISCRLSGRYIFLYVNF